MPARLSVSGSARRVPTSIRPFERRCVMAGEIFRAPDNIVIPTGAGSNVLGLDIGFGELLRRGEIARLPRLFAAQPANCAPFSAAFAAGTAGCPPIESKATIAEGTAIARPV